MKRLIFLKVDVFSIPNDLNKTQFAEAEKKLIQKNVKSFRDQLKERSDIKIIKDYLPRPEVLVEFADKDYDDIYNYLRVLSVVETIDFTLNKD